MVFEKLYTNNNYKLKNNKNYDTRKSKQPGCKII